MDEHAPIHHAVIKVVSAVGVFMTIDLWTTAGKVCAATYSMLIMAEWLWKRVIKPLSVRLGWIKTPNVITQDTEV